MIDAEERALLDASLESAIATFVNASTVDGFNPYRVTRAGIDWEVEDPDDAWSNIGYWGDHQIVYLLKLLEAHEAFHPGALARLLDRAVVGGAVEKRHRPGVGPRRGVTRPAGVVHLDR